MKVIFEKKNSSFVNMKLYPFESCTRGLDCEQRRVVLGPPFFSTSGHSSPKFLTNLKWRLFGISGIMGLKIQNNFLITIWDIQVGSRALVTLRHSLADFDQIRIVLRWIFVHPEWRWFLKRQILHLQIWNHIWIPIWELYTWSPFSQLRAQVWPTSNEHCLQEVELWV